MALGRSEKEAILDFVQDELDRDANSFSEVPERNGFTSADEWDWTDVAQYMKDNRHSINKVVTAYWDKETSDHTDRELEYMGWQR
jgi:hypothetical protein